MKLEIHPVEEKGTWDKFVLRYAPVALFQSWLWGKVQVCLGNPLWRYGLYEGKSLVGLFQIVKVAARRGTFLHVRHGPVLVSQKKRHWRPVVSFFREKASEERALFVRLSPQIDDTHFNRQLLKHFGMRPAAIHAMDGEYCWVLDLAPSEEELLAAMRKTTRYEVRQAARMGVTVTVTGDPRRLPDFFRLYQATTSRHNFVPHQGIAEEFKVFASEDQAKLFLAYREQQLLSAAIVLFYGDQAIYHHGASIVSKVPASYLVQWQAIKEAKKRGMKVYNFWGISSDNATHHPWRGITLFKKGFGGREVRFIHAHDLPVSPFYIVPRIVETARRLIKGY